MWSFSLLRKRGFGPSSWVHLTKTAYWKTCGAAQLHALLWEFGDIWTWRPQPLSFNFGYGFHKTGIWEHLHQIYTHTQLYKQQLKNKFWILWSYTFMCSFTHFKRQCCGIFLNSHLQIKKSGFMAYCLIIFKFVSKVQPI